MARVRVKREAILYGVLIFLIAALGFYLRVRSVHETHVIAPLRADAGQYFAYAYNLRHKGTYSYDVGNPHDLSSPVRPDAMRPPGYPLFLMGFVDGLPNEGMISRIMLTQAIVSGLTIMAAYCFFLHVLPAVLSLSACLIIAISPHLIVMNSYILTETLFCFLLVILGWQAGRFARRPGSWAVLSLGLLMGLLALVRSSMQYMPLVFGLFLIVHWGWKRGFEYAVVCGFGFALVLSPWIGRNLLTLNRAADDRLAVSFLHHGIYPNFTYEGSPESYGYPYRFDPRSQEISQDTNSVLKEIKRRFWEEPTRHLMWFILKKPVSFWSWNIVQGMGDAFVYPVSDSPYFSDHLFQWSHWMSFHLHWSMVVLALCGSVLVWFPVSLLGISTSVQFTARFCSVLLLYFTLIHMIGVPFPRYSVPLRPFLYGMGLYTVYVLIIALNGRWRLGKNSHSQGCAS